LPVLKIALAQINPVVGDLSGNAGKVADYIRQATAQKARLVVFPELAISGYPPEDLLFRQGFVEACQGHLERLAVLSHQIDLIIGYPRFENGRLMNSAAYLTAGRIAQIYDKQLLPNYGVFDEMRYFAAGNRSAVIKIDQVRIGLTICEDIWQSGPVQQAVSDGAQFIVNINASPYHVGKRQERMQTIAARCAESSVPVVYVNLVGGQDELVFDGHSMVVDARGKKLLQMTGFAEQLAVFELNEPHAEFDDDEINEDEEAYQALLLAVRDYVTKNGFQGAVIGLSGGVDSALTLALAVDALGADQVEAVMMPSRYTSEISLHDARLCASNFAVQYKEISIEQAFHAMLTSLTPELADQNGTWPPDTTQENIQARCRGIILMAISNKKGKLVLATGNKSEMSVGYATLYGDMAGGFAPLKDVSKERVYRLCRYRNQGREMIPARIIDRPPSAELAANQKDEDSLPPYPVLDKILELYLEQEKSIDFILNKGFSEPVVRDVVSRINRNEYKRRQAAPGVKITRRALGRERRYPITSRYQ
jgi:NAD+ synthase (glutamine-hydrolysing)